MTPSKTGVTAASGDADGEPRVEATGGVARLSRFWRSLGPGLITGASDDDPSGIATYAQTGAQFAYAPTWSLLFSYPLMTAIQIISARLGRTTGRGVAGNLCRYFPSSLAYGAVALLAVANMINIGADIGAMADSVRVMIGGPQILYVILFGAGCVAAEIYMSYERYVRILKWMTLSLFAYVATLFFAKVDWLALLRSMIVPQLSMNADYLTAIVAIFGTTISPYLFFWQASEEVDNLQASPGRRPLKKAPRQAEGARRRINLDTMTGMAFSNIIGLSIMATAAATLHEKHIDNLASSAQVAETLRPTAGVLAEFIFALGIVGAGLLAVPVLAGSAAYAVGETLHRPTGLNRKPHEAKTFYAVIALATLVGVALNFTPINPIKALYWSAIVNGVAAVPIMVLMMLMARNPNVMGKETIRLGLLALGWLATGLMAAIAVAMIAMLIV